jgi:hypothetical protein
MPLPHGLRSGTRKVLNRASSGKLSAVLVETRPTTAAATSFDQPRGGLTFAQLDFNAMSALTRPCSTAAMAAAPRGRWGPLVAARKYVTRAVRSGLT